MGVVITLCMRGWICSHVCFQILMLLQIKREAEISANGKSFGSLLLKSMICFGYEFAKQCVRLIVYGQFMGNNYITIHESLHLDLGMRTG